MESTTQNIGLTLYYDRKYQNYGSVQIDNLSYLAQNIGLGIWCLMPRSTIF